MPVTFTTVDPAAPRTHVVVDSPIGRLTLIGVDGVLTRLSMHDQRHLPEQLDAGEPDTGALAVAVAQLGEYFAGERTDFDLAVAPEGSAFQCKVWAALTDIPYGQTAGYGELAQRIGAPGAARAVGLANGRNPVAVVVPCHRVIGAGGALTGYGGGLERKRYLLALERGRRAGHDDDALFDLAVCTSAPAATYPRSHRRPGVRERGVG